jgi:uncharacterized protein HemX
MILNNFLFRVGQAIRENRARLIKLLAIVAAAFVLAGLIYYGVELLHKARYEKRVQSLEKQFRDAEEQAKAADARADAKQKEIDAKQAELQFLAARANAADDALRNVRQRVVTLKETYENIRYVPMPAGPVSCADACRDLASVGYACK